MVGVMRAEIVNWEEAAVRLARGEIGVIPTDTVYGLVGLAQMVPAVERIYSLRNRDLDKPLITLVADVDELGHFQAGVDRRAQKLFKAYWPGPVSFVVPVPSSGWQHIHRGVGSIAFRSPQKQQLRSLLQQVGPLVAPSANKAGQPVAQNVPEAVAYFGPQVFYVDEGELYGSPSALIDLTGAEPKVLRDSPEFDRSLL